MKRYWSYLKYVLRHKWYVSVECFHHGLIWRGLKHDWSKFLPDEFIPYARYFYEPNGSQKKKRNSTGYYQATDTGDSAFDIAWLKHQHRQDHHWQWWTLLKDDGSIRILDMSQDARLEMICDWVGAGKAQGFFSPPSDPLQETRRWYEKNYLRMKLSPVTSSFVSGILNAHVE